MEQTISVKELRLKLPSILERVEKGERFTIIYHSKPIGALSPLWPLKIIPKGALKRLANPPKHLMFSSNKSAVDIVRELRK